MVWAWLKSREKIIDNKLLIASEVLKRDQHYWGRKSPTNEMNVFVIIFHANFVCNLILIDNKGVQITDNLVNLN